MAPHAFRTLKVDLPSEFNFLSLALFQFLKGHDLVASEYLHLSVRSHTIVADELGTLAAKRFCFCSRTHFANSFHFSLRFLHFGVELFHTIDKKCRGQLIGVVLGQKGPHPALGACEGAVGPGSEGQLSDALLAVVVEAWKDLGLTEVILQVISSSSCSNPFSTTPGASAIATVDYFRVERVTKRRLAEGAVGEGKIPVTYTTPTILY